MAAHKHAFLFILLPLVQDKSPIKSIQKAEIIVARDSIG